MHTRSKSRNIIQKKIFYPIHPIDLQGTINHLDTIRQLNEGAKYNLDIFIYIILAIFLFLIISILLEIPVIDKYTQLPFLF